MGDTNYFSGIVKILENPVQKLVKKKTKTRPIVSLDSQE